MNIDGRAGELLRLYLILLLVLIHCTAVLLYFPTKERGGRTLLVMSLEILRQSTAGGRRSKAKIKQKILFLPVSHVTNNQSRLVRRKNTGRCSLACGIDMMTTHTYTHTSLHL